MLVPPTGVALPVVKTLQDCTDFSRTVSPYLPQLKALPWQVLHNISSWESLKTLYVSTNPLVSSFALSLFLAPIFLVASEANKNYSQVDRLWSILPTIYNAHYVMWAHMTGLPTQRLNNLLLFSLIWSVRYTFKTSQTPRLTDQGSSDFQLLAEGRILHRLRRLPMASPAREAQSDAHVHLQCSVQLAGTKREYYSLGPSGI